MLGCLRYKVYEPSVWFVDNDQPVDAVLCVGPLLNPAISRPGTIEGLGLCSKASLWCVWALEADHDFRHRCRRRFLRGLLPEGQGAQYTKKQNSESHDGHYTADPDRRAEYLPLTF